MWWTTAGGGVRRPSRSDGGGDGPPSLLLLVIFVLSQVAVVVFILQHSGTNPLCSGADAGGARAAALAAPTHCVQAGLQGPYRPGAVATIVLAMKGVSAHTYNSGGLRHLKYIMHSRSLIAADINFVVMTANCPMAQLARDLGFATIHPESGSAAGDLTYNHAFELVTRFARTPIVGFANSDIIFLDGLSAALRAVVDDERTRRWPKFFLTGVRKNVDVPDALMPMERPIDDAIWSNFTTFIGTHGQMFQDITADYFLWSRRGEWDWRALPPFLIGGIGFDNWIVGWASGTGGITTVNLTPAVAAIHVNHGSGGLKLYGSHFSPASSLNEEVFKKFGMVGSCDVKDLDWAVQLQQGRPVLKRQR